VIASVKFLIPFSLLVGIGSRVGGRALPAIAQPEFSIVVEQISQPFTSAVIPAAAPAAESSLLPLWMARACAPAES